MTSRVLLLVLATVCPGCGQAPKADRIRRDTNDTYYPQRDIHFVEHGQRSKGVLVAATEGFDSAFRANWVTVLVPVAPSTLEGPAWTGRAAGGDRARAIATLPPHRRVFEVILYGDSGRFRFRAPAAWVLGTDPFILGLPAGAPRLSWGQYALKATGVTKAQVGTPLDAWVTRFVVDEELDQPLERLVVYPANFWAVMTPGKQGIELTVVTLKEPLSIRGALDAIAAGDPARLGTTEVVPLDETFASERDHSRAINEDKQRLMRQ